MTISVNLIFSAIAITLIDFVVKHTLLFDSNTVHMIAYRHALDHSYAKCWWGLAYVAGTLSISLFLLRRDYYVQVASSAMTVYLCDDRKTFMTYEIGKLMILFVIVQFHEAIFRNLNIWGFLQSSIAQKTTEHSNTSYNTAENIQESYSGDIDNLTRHGSHVGQPNNPAIVRTPIGSPRSKSPIQKERSNYCGRQTRTDTLDHARGSI